MCIRGPKAGTWGDPAVSVPVSRDKIVAGPGHCRALLLQLAAAAPTEPLSVLFRRENHRWTLNAPAAIRYTAGDGRQVIVEAAVSDLSATGVGLVSDQPLPADLPAEVFVTVKNRVYSAAVRVVHTTAAGEKVRIGCEFVVREASR